MPLVIHAHSAALRRRLADHLGRLRMSLPRGSALTLSVGAEGTLHLFLYRAGARSLHVGRRAADPVDALEQALLEAGQQLQREVLRARRVVVTRAPPERSPRHSIDRAAGGGINPAHGPL